MDTAIRAVHLAVKKVPGLKLLLVGDQGKTPLLISRFKKLIEKYDIKDNVEILPWQDFETIRSFIQASDLCIVPHKRSPHTDTTIPHKLFQYMLLGRAVLASDNPPLKRMVEITGGGLVFKGDNPEDMAEKILRMYHEGSESYGKRGQQAVMENYLWEERDSRRLVELYRELIGD